MRLWQLLRYVQTWSIYLRYLNPEPEQLDERFESWGAASGNPDQEQLDDGLATREALRTVYRDYIRTRQRTIDLKDELRITRGLYLGLIQAHHVHLRSWTCSGPSWIAMEDQYTLLSWTIVFKRTLLKHDPTFPDVFNK